MRTVAAASLVAFCALFYMAEQAVATPAAAVQVAAAPDHPPWMACTRGDNGRPGTGLYRCYCLEWAPNHKICRRIHGGLPDTIEPDVNCGSIACDPGGGYPPYFCRPLLNGFHAFLNDQPAVCQQSRSPGRGFYDPRYGYYWGCNYGGELCWWWKREL